MEADAVLREIEEATRVRFLPIIGPVKGVILVQTIAKYKVGKVLEIGTLVGYSAILMAQNLPEGGLVHTIEINPRSAARAIENIRRANLAGKVTVFTGDALDIIPALNQRYDMLFLDAAKSEYLSYLKLAEKKLRADGVVVADNVKIFAGEMSDYLDYVRRSGRYRSEYFDMAFDGVEVSRRIGQ